jgi:hypothetical protein
MIQMNNLTTLEFINLYDKCIVCGDKIVYTMLFSKDRWNTFPGSIVFELEDKNALTFKKAGLTCSMYKPYNEMAKIFEEIPNKVKISDNGNINNEKFSSVFDIISLRADCKNEMRQTYYTDHFWFNTEQKKINKINNFSLSAEKVYAHGISIKYDHTYQLFTASTDYAHMKKIDYRPLTDFPFDSKEKLENKINAILLLQ